jgi:hypothetical protein
MSAPDLGFVVEQIVMAIKKDVDARHKSAQDGKKRS